MAGVHGSRLAGCDVVWPSGRGQAPSALQGALGRAQQPALRVAARG